MIRWLRRDWLDSWLTPVVVVNLAIIMVIVVGLLWEHYHENC